MIKKLDTRYIPSIKEVQDKINEMIDVINTVCPQPPKKIRYIGKPVLIPKILPKIYKPTVPKPPDIIMPVTKPISPEEAIKKRDGVKD